MDIWLANSRSQADASQKKSKGKGKTEERPRYPILEPGAVTSATLQERDGRLEWHSVQQNNTARRLVSSSKLPPVLSFPATRPAPLRKPPTTVTQRAEQGAHFLRTHYPDVDIPAELIMDQVTTEARLAESLEEFDPYLGNRLESFRLPGRHLKRYAFVAFPTGENACDLNISEIEFSANHGVIMRPTAQANRTFETPIRQIVAATQVPGKSVESAILSVRTYTSTSLILITSPTSWSDEHATTVEAVDLASFTPSELSNRQPVDVQISQDLNQAVLVNDRGNLYRHTFGNSSGLEKVYDNSLHHAEGPDSQFWRVGLTQHADIFSIMSSRDLAHVDLRTRERGIPIFSVRRPKEVLTSIEYSQNPRMTKVVTTSELVWIDERNQSRPILAYKHARQYDRTLQSSTVELGHAVLTVLSSRKNNLMTVYDVSRDGQGSVHGWTSPYQLRHQFSTPGSHAGFHLIRAPTELQDHTVALLQLSNLGNVHQSVLTLTPDGAPPNVALPAVADWSDEVQALYAHSLVARPDMGLFGSRDKLEVDLRPAYRRLFYPSDPGESVFPPQHAEAVYQTLEKMPLFFQESDITAEHMLTTFDIAFRSGEEPGHASRADFLTRSSLSTTRGYRALVQNRVPRDKLTKAVAWHHNIAPFLGQFVPDISDDVQVMAERLKKYDLAVDDDRTGASLRRETEAREQLTLDLALSLDVFSPRSFAKRQAPPPFDGDALETMSQATEALTLAEGDLPPVHFGYLDPALKIDHYMHAGNQQDSEARNGEDLPLGVRLLLSEWDVGDDPEAYVFYDPYGSEPRDSRSRAHPAARPTRTTSRPAQPAQGVSEAHPPPVIPSQKPPPVVAAPLRAPPAIASSQPFAAAPPGFSQVSALPFRRNGSMTAAADHGFTQPSPASQELMTSTQVVPGPFGGRQSVGKKKPVKKRLGGF